ncbi:hypothetical protein SAY86_009181 [Trapa natans]|uniref:Uncharacterized protein n=1 Tax=Trapa natans TaxID=22666 RepID=A0AAN7QCE6_TRANT|nr:hypothetical protein SAY86_009181 [Trapa natans]
MKQLTLTVLTMQMNELMEQKKLPNLTICRRDDLHLLLFVFICVRTGARSLQRLSSGSGTTCARVSRNIVRNANARSVKLPVRVGHDEAAVAVTRFCDYVVIAKDESPRRERERKNGNILKKRKN